MTHQLDHQPLMTGFSVLYPRFMLHILYLRKVPFILLFLSLHFLGLFQLPVMIVKQEERIKLWIKSHKRARLFSCLKITFLFGFRVSRQSVLLKRSSWQWLNVSLGCRGKTLNTDLYKQTRTAFLVMACMQILERFFGRICFEASF